MPTWVQFVIGGAALVAALGVLWTKLLRPGAKLISGIDEALPLIAELNSSFRGNLDGLTVLSDIAEQFKPNGGTSLRDVINRLDAVTQANAEATADVQEKVDDVRTKAEHDRALAGEDRTLLHHLADLLDKVSSRVALTASRVQHLPTVLFIEDDAIQRRALQRQLESSRPLVRLVSTARGSTGMQLAAELGPNLNLILLDLYLPDVTGEALLSMLRDDPSTANIPVVIVSGDDLPSTMARLSSLGANDFIVKPYALDRLLEVIDRFAV